MAAAAAQDSLKKRTSECQRHSGKQANIWIVNYNSDSLCTLKLLSLSLLLTNTCSAVSGNAHAELIFHSMFSACCYLLWPDRYTGCALLSSFSSPGDNLQWVKIQSYGHIVHMCTIFIRSAHRFSSHRIASHRIACHNMVSVVTETFVRKMQHKFGFVVISAFCLYWKSTNWTACRS